MMMSPRQRWLALLDRQPTDRIPTDYQATPEVTQRLLVDLGCANEDALWRKLHIDKRKYVESQWRLPHHPDDPQADMWGVRYQRIDYGTGAYDEPAHCPLAAAETVADVHTHRWPDPADFDYSVIARTLDKDDGYWPIHSCCYEPFLLCGYLRGLERAFEDLVLRPELADAILGHVVDFYYEHQRRCFEAGGGRIHLTWIAEDLGSQSGPLMGLPMYRRFLLPNQLKMANLARSYGIHIMYRRTESDTLISVPPCASHGRPRLLGHRRSTTCSGERMLGHMPFSCVHHQPPDQVSNDVRHVA